MKSKKLTNVLTLGFALFAMFFGAGNLLLPPLIGVEVGSNYFVAMLAFGLTGILLPFTGILSVVFSGNSFNDLGHRVNKHLAEFTLVDELRILNIRKPSIVIRLEICNQIRLQEQEVYLKLM